MSSGSVQGTCMGRNRTARDNSIVPWLVAIGIVASWLAWVLIAQSIGTTSDEGFSGPQSKPLIYYALHGTGLLMMMTAGALAAARGEYRRMSQPVRIAFWGLVITSAIWAGIAYGLDDYLSFKALGATGPFVWFSCATVFAGMYRPTWRLLAPVIRGVAYLTAVLALYAIATDYGVISERWLSAPVYYMILLMWFGGWTFLTSGESRGWRLLLNCFPYAVFVLTTIVTQTRSWFMMSMFLLFAFLHVSPHSPQHSSGRSRKRLAVFGLLVLMLLTAAVLLQDTLARSFSALGERATTDSRSGQYVEFFHQVPLVDLVLGRGPNGSWEWNGKDYQFFDNAYIWMSFIGGIPILMPYFVLIIMPGIRAFLHRVRGDDAVAAILVLLWGLACSGFSTYSNPSLTPYSYFVCMLSGRCLGYLSEMQSNRK